MHYSYLDCMRYYVCAILIPLYALREALLQNYVELGKYAVLEITWHFVLPSIFSEKWKNPDLSTKQTRESAYCTSRSFLIAKRSTITTQLRG